MKSNLTRPGAKQDRNDSPYGLTRSVCPVCRDVIDARLVNRGGELVMRKWCSQHGWFEALVARDVQRYDEQRRFNKPGTIPLHFERDYRGCPESCGICPEHQQHSCLGIIDVTDQCDLACPVCFAAAKCGTGTHLSLEQIAAMMDRLIRAEGDPEVIQLSGGEPTLHPQIVDIVRTAREKGLRKVLLNTNGLRLAEDDALLDALAEHDPSVYLQFDGFEPDTHRRLRGRDLSELKQRVVDRLSERGFRIVLVATVVRGINDHELGALVDYALDHDQIRCLNFQPATQSGRFGLTTGGSLVTDPLERITLDDVVDGICAQSRHGFVAEDFFPIPCPDPACSRATYIHKADGEVRPIPRLVDVEDYLDYVKNVSVPQVGDKVKEALESLFSMGAAPGEETTGSFCAACGIDVDLGAIEREITMISMMHFMDEHDFDLRRASKCCVHQILPDDGGIVPFCVYNVLRRGR